MKKNVINYLRKVVRCIVYPFRKHLFWVLLVLFVGAYFFPVLKYKVAYSDVFSWYKNKFYQVKEDTSIPVVKKGTDQLVYREFAPEVAMVGRRGFAQSKGAEVKGFDVLSQQSEDVVDVDAVMEEDEEENVQVGETESTVAPRQNFVQKKEQETTQDKEKKVKKLDITEGEYSGLDYLAEHQIVEGGAFVVNVNEIVVKDTYVFLYGIYSNPRTETGVKGAVFLRSILKDEKVRCEILAHVIGDGTATAECFVGDESINQMLIDEGYSKKVSAK